MIGDKFEGEFWFHNEFRFLNPTDPRTRTFHLLPSILSLLLSLLFLTGFSISTVYHLLPHFYFFAAFFLRSICTHFQSFWTSPYQHLRCLFFPDLFSACMATLPSHIHYAILLQLSFAL